MLKINIALYCNVWALFFLCLSSFRASHVFGGNIEKMWASFSPLSRTFVFLYDALQVWPIHLPRGLTWVSVILSRYWSWKFSHMIRGHCCFFLSFDIDGYLIKRSYLSDANCQGLSNMRCGNEIWNRSIEKHVAFYSVMCYQSDALFLPDNCKVFCLANARRVAVNSRWRCKNHKNSIRVILSLMTKTDVIRPRFTNFCESFFLSLSYDFENTMASLFVPIFS